MSVEAAWQIFVNLIHAIWETGSVPQQMLPTVIVLLLKGGSNYRGIELLDPLWKCIEVVMDNRLKI